jgi:hypothetical protein
VYHVTYWNADANGGAGAYEVLNGATYSVNITDDQTGQIVGNEGGSIGEDGEIVICTYQGVGYNGSVRLEDIYGNRVIPTDAAFFAGGNTQQYSGYYELIASSSTSRAFMNLLPTISGSQALLGFARPPINVNVTSSISNSYYSPNDDHIYIKSTHVWHEWGIFTMGHEYGHAAHERALNHIEAYGSCPDSHFIDRGYSLGCAWTEGFADFHGAFVRGDALILGGSDGVSDYQFEINKFYPGGDGSIVEGSVAAFLNDLIDGPNDPNSSTNQLDGDDDSVQYPGNYLATLMRTCAVTKSFGNQWRNEDGIDDLIYCLERQVDPAVRNSSTYFVTRPDSLKANSESESATEPPNWTQSAIRTLWTRNLYGQ